MKVEEFVRYIADSDINALIGEDRHTEFHEFLEHRFAEGKDKIIFRFLFEKNNEDDIPTPYYVWVVYPIVDHDEFYETTGVAEMIPPDFDNPTSYLSIPEELEGEPYFEAYVP